MGRTALLPLSPAAEFRVIDPVPQHDPQPDAQLARGGQPRFPQPLLHQLAPVEAAQFRVQAHRVHGRLAPEVAQQRVALFGERPQPLPPSAGVLTRSHPE